MNIWQGAVSSGKTFSSLICLADLLKDGPKGDVMILGYSRGTIQRNVLKELYSFLGWPIPTDKKMSDKLYGRDVYFVGANDVSAVSTIQGSTLALAYVDEATKIPQVCWNMLLSRLRKPGARLLATCNPEGPRHWLKKEFLDNPELNLKTWRFLLDDNPNLNEQYKSDLKKTYTGMWYNRYILGEWAVAHGLIYDGFDNDNLYQHPLDPPNYYICGIDYGTSNATAAVLCGVRTQRWPQINVEQEYYYDSNKAGRQKTDDELATDIYKFVQYKNISAIYVDPSAASLKLELRRRDLPVLDAKNDLLPGIKTTAKFISGKNIVIHHSCTNLRESIQSYCWDPAAADRGEDKPLKKFEHICDSLRYCVFSAFPQGEFSSPDENITIEQLRKKVFENDSYGFINPLQSGGYF